MSLAEHLEGLRIMKTAKAKERNIASHLVTARFDQEHIPHPGRTNSSAGATAPHRGAGASIDRYLQLHRFGDNETFPRKTANI